MVTYKERMQDKKYFVLVYKDEVLATFGNLKKVIKFMNGKDFYSYHTLTRKELPVTYNDYKLFKVNHF